MRSVSSAGILKQCMGARNRVGIGSSYLARQAIQAGRIDSLESAFGLLRSLKIRAKGVRLRVDIEQNHLGVTTLEDVCLDLRLGRKHVQNCNGLFIAADLIHIRERPFRGAVNLNYGSGSSSYTNIFAGFLLKQTVLLGTFKITLFDLCRCSLTWIDAPITFFFTIS